MILTEDYLTNILPQGDNQETKAEELRVLYLNGFDINDIILKNSIINRIEFLSLQNNNLKNLDFIKTLDNLWYLDIRKNPIEDFSAFETKKKFGFLGISIEKISEKAIGDVRNLLVGIFYLKIENKNIENKFISQNPKIFRKNQEFNFDFMFKNFYSESEKNEKNFNDTLDSNNNNNNTNNYEDLPYSEIDKIFSKNKFLALKYFFKKIEKIRSKIFEILSNKNNEINKTNNNNNNTINPNENSNKSLMEKIKKKEYDKIETNTAFNYYNNNNNKEKENKYLANLLLELEKLNLIFYKKLLESFIILNKNKKEIFNKDYKNYFINPISYLLSNKTIEEKNFYYDLNFLRSPNILKQLAFIVIIPLHFLNIISKEISSNLIIFLLNLSKKNFSYYQINSEINKLELDISRFFDLDFSLKFGIFFDLINKLKRYYSFTKSQNKSDEFFPSENSKGKTFINKERFEEILDFLDNISLLGKLKTLQEKKYFFSKENFEKNIFEELLANDNNLISEVFIIIQILKEILTSLKYNKKSISIINQNLVVKKNDYEFFEEIEKFIFDIFTDTNRENKIIKNKNSALIFFDLFDFIFSNEKEKKINLNKKDRDILYEQIKGMKLINFFEMNRKIYLSENNKENEYENSEDDYDNNSSKKLRVFDFERNRILKNIFDSDEKRKNKNKKNKIKIINFNNNNNNNNTSEKDNTNNTNNSSNTIISNNNNNFLSISNKKINNKNNKNNNNNRLNSDKLNEHFNNNNNNNENFGKIGKRIVLSRLSNVKPPRISSLDLKNFKQELFKTEEDNNDKENNIKINILTNYKNFYTPMNKEREKDKENALDNNNNTNNTNNINFNSTLRSISILNSPKNNNKNKKDLNINNNFDNNNNNNNNNFSINKIKKEKSLKKKFNELDININNLEFGINDNNKNNKTARNNNNINNSEKNKQNSYLENLNVNNINNTKAFKLFSGNNNEINKLRENSPPIIRNKYSTSRALNKLIPMKKGSPINNNNNDLNTFKKNSQNNLNFNTHGNSGNNNNSTNKKENNRDLKELKELKEFSGVESLENENNEMNENHNFISSNKNNFKLPTILNTEYNFNFNKNKANNLYTKKIKNNSNIKANNNNTLHLQENTLNNTDINNTNILNNTSSFNNNNLNDNIDNIIQLQLNTSRDKFEYLRDNNSIEGLNNINNFNNFNNLNLNNLNNLSNTNKKNKNIFKSKTEYLEEKKHKFLLLNENYMENETINNSKEISSLLKEKKNGKIKPKKKESDNSNSLKTFNEKFEFKNLNNKNTNSSDFNFRSTQLSLLNNYLKELKNENYMQKTSLKFEDKNFNFNKFSTNIKFFDAKNKNNNKSMEKIKNFEMNSRNYITKYNENFGHNNTNSTIPNNKTNTNETIANSSDYMKSEKNEMGTNTIPNMENETKNTKNSPKEKKKNLFSFNSEKLKDKKFNKKEFVNFNANIKRIIHHWNKNNSKQKNLENDEIRINEFEKIQRRNKMRFLMMKKQEG